MTEPMTDEEVWEDIRLVFLDFINKVLLAIEAREAGIR